MIPIKDNYEISLHKYKYKQYSFNLRKIKPIEIKYILQRKEYKTQKVFVKNRNLLLTTC